MEKNGGGVIINISSVAAIRYIGIPYITYYASKAGILGLTQGIALQYADKHIRANAILPGLMNTPLIREPLKDFYGGERHRGDDRHTGQEMSHGKDGGCLGRRPCRPVSRLG